LCAARAAANQGCLIVALGRKAGYAATRSRIRRLARDVFKAGLLREGGTLNLLLFVRKDVSDQPRRKVRQDLQSLLARVPETIRRRDAREAQRAVDAKGGSLSP
jgi:ribonuclease P protein component